MVIEFYRPGRWSFCALEEEILFLEDLREAKVPCTRPIGNVGTWKGLYYIIFEKVLQPCNSDRQIHDVGSKRGASARAQFDPVGMCSGCYEVIQTAGFLPKSLQARYEKVIEELISKITSIGDIPTQRIHGDIYIGNIMWSPDEPVFIDLDDFLPIGMSLDLLKTTSSMILLILIGGKSL